MDELIAGTKDKMLNQTVCKIESELHQLEDQHDSYDCPDGWMQVELPPKLSTKKQKFQDMQDRIYERRRGK